MLQKITELWPGLIRGYSTDHFSSQNDQPSEPIDGDGSGESGESNEFNEEQILVDYKNLFWTRLIRIEGYESGHSRKYKMGPDIVEECVAVIQMPEPHEPQWKPIFEPY